MSDTPKIGSEVFDNDPETAAELLWWCIHLLGGSVVFPANQEFWNANYPADSRLIMRHDDCGNVVLVAEQKVWQQTS